MINSTAPEGIDKKPTSKVVELTSRLSIKKSIRSVWRQNFRAERPPLYTPPPSAPLEIVQIKEPSESSSHKTQIESLNDSTQRPVVAVIGIGYIGMHLVSTFAAYYEIIAFDISESRLKQVAAETQFSEPHSIVWTSNPLQLCNASHLLVAVPTPIQIDKCLNTTFLQAAMDLIELYATPGATVVIESSVSVGMTRKFLRPLMERKGLKGGMSPERVDPGRTEPPIEKIPKIISGLDDITPGSLSSISDLYDKVFQKIVTVSRPEVAEMMKLYENCQRMVCIAYANEMADACKKIGIDPFEVSQAASTKPFGYLPIHPSLGVGGTCIPVNPYYLFQNNEFPLLRAATDKMHSRPLDLGDGAMTALLSRHPGKFKSKKPRILVVGAAFKYGVSSTAMSPSVELMKRLLKKWAAEVCYADPCVDESAISFARKLDEKDWNEETLQRYDLIFITVKQPGLDLQVLDRLNGVQIEKWTA